MKDTIKICFPEREDDLDLLSLPFKSSYRVLSWQGAASGVLLTPDFVLADIQGRFMVIKSIKVTPYYSAAAVDMFVNDGVTTNAETIPINGRIDRLFDLYTTGTTINMIINGGQVNLFNANFPLDIDLQNIYYKYPEKIQDLTLQITGTVYTSIVASTTQNPNVKVNMEVYLI